jgi:alpha-galactosidase
MAKHAVVSALLFAIPLLAAPPTSAQHLAATPPMGWNSWDAYGFTIDESQFKANALILASIEQFGWKYAVIDEGWYMADPSGSNLDERKYLWNNNGLLVPVPARYPSAADGAGFKPLADWVHAQGLKFGVHIVRGIPRQVVAANLPIAGTSFRAADAADTSSPCPWDDGNWGIKDNAAGQAYYDSMLKLYASWGLDFLKVDCIATNPYRPSEIRQIAEAIRKSGRPIVLSLSPGPTALDHAGEVAKYAQMWRISGDHWDGWDLPHKETDEFPFGLHGAFDRLAQWSPHAGPGHWPDADMLPDGWLGPHPGWGEVRQSRLTHDEQRTEFTLWAIARSPLILGANLTRLDAFTRSLITNQDVISIDQSATHSHPIDTAALGPGWEHARIWRATINEPGARGYAEYFAFFNLDSKPLSLHTSWKQLGLKGTQYTAQNLWDKSSIKGTNEISATLPPHGCALFKVY